MINGAQTRTYIAYLLMAFCVFVGALNFSERLQTGVPTDQVPWRDSGQGLVSAGPLTAPLESSKRIQAGDRLLQIGGIPVQNLDEHTEVLEVLASELDGEPVTYLIERPATGQKLSFPIRLEWRSTMDFASLGAAFVGLIHLLIGFVIFSKSSRQPGALHFFLVCLIAFALYFLRTSGAAGSLDLVVYWMIATTFLLLPPLLLDFSLVFPERLVAGVAGLTVRRLLYLPALSLLCIHILWFSGRLEALGVPRNPEFGSFFDRLHLLHFSSFLLASIGACLYSYWNTVSAVRRQQTKWISYGLALGLIPFGLLYAVPFVSGVAIKPWMQISVLSLGLVPLGFAYAIARYRLMDVDLIFRQSIGYLTTSAVLLSLYLLLVFGIGQLVNQLAFGAQSSTLLFTTSALLIALLFAPLKNSIQARIDSYFAQGRPDYRESIREFGVALTNEVRFDQLVDKVCSRLQETLGVQRVEVFLRLGDSDAFQQYGKTDSDPIEVHEDQLSIFDLDPFAASAVGPLNGSTAPLSRVGQPMGCVVPLRTHGRATGFLRIADRNGAPLSSRDLEIVRVLATFAAIAFENAFLYDSLEQKNNQLEQLKAYSERVIESITLGLAVVDPGGRITVWNQEMESLLEIPAGQALGKEADQVLPADLVKKIHTLSDNSWNLNDKVRVHRARLQPDPENPQTRLIDLVGIPFIQPNDIHRGMMILLEDVTEKSQLQSQLQMAERLSSIGVFAAGIAHEVNTPLAGICSYAQMLLKKTEKDDPRYEVLQKVEKQSFRAARILQNLLNSTRLGDSTFENVQVNSLMLETLSLVDTQLKKSGVEVEVDLDPSLPSSVANGGRLQQVLMNLFLNAHDAMPRGGRLKVKTFQKNSHLIIEVADSGVGIEKEHIKKIYDPFFTTKGLGKGAGLGLSVSYGIIQEHAGQMNVVSKKGNGTTFTIELPIQRVQ